MLHKTLLRKKRHTRVRGKVTGTAEKPRLAVYRSNARMYAQLIDDVTGTTLVSAHDKAAKGTKTERATAVGTDIAEKAKKAKISSVVFDRGGFAYIGRVKALADAAREGGLQF